jgi:chromosome segregation protein
VEDILRELNANLDKLEKQAEVAAQYNALQAGHAQAAPAVVPEARRGRGRAGQVRTEGLQAVNELESRMADLRNIEAELETIRQAHYAAGDQVNQAQGKLYEATAEVGKLEAEIRYVVEGRQRVEQRLVQLAEQMLPGARAAKRPRASWKHRPAGHGCRRAGRDAGRPARRAGHALPDLEDALRQAQKANEQRQLVVQVQQQIQVLAAEQRSTSEQLASWKPGTNACAPTAMRWPRRTKRA